MTKVYILMETTKIDDFDTKKEAEANRDNLSIWYPENSYEVVEQDLSEWELKE